MLHLTERGDWHQQRFRAAAPSGITLIQRRPSLDPDWRSSLADVDVVVSERNVPVDAGAIDSARCLRLIVRLGSLAHDIAIDSAVRRGIVVSRQPVALCAACAEHALMLMLAVKRRLPELARLATEGDPDRPPRVTDEDTFAFNWLGRTDLGCIAGSRICLLGMGEIGVELARRLRAFGSEVVRYVKRNRYPSAVETELGITWSPLDAALGGSDILVNLLPWSPETHRLLDADRLALLPAGAALVQVGSGGTLDEADLLAALASGAMSGAALDTFEWEPLPADHPLAIAGRNPASGVLLTPHVAAVGRDNSPERDWDEVERFLRREPLRHRIT
ncbi:MAG: NAD(P)-dependent oxidoreductase [Armatimonadota bacterium]